MEESVKKFNFEFMKKLLSAILLLMVFGANAQIYTKPNNSYGTISNRVSIDSTLFFPTGCGVPLDTLWLFSQGFNGNAEKKHKFALYGDSCGHMAYIWEPSLQAWMPLGGGMGVDSIYNRGDSAFYRMSTIEKFAFLLGTGGSTDTTSLSNRINLKRDITDTSYAHHLQTRERGQQIADSMGGLLDSKMINYGGAPGYLEGPFASLPAATSYPTGTQYIAADSGFHYVDTGAGGSRGWKLIRTSNSGGSASLILPSRTYPGNITSGTATYLPLNYRDAYLLDFVPAGISITDSSHDATPYIRAARDFLGINGGIIWYPSGKIRVDDSVKFAVAVRNEGTGPVIGSEFNQPLGGRRQGGTQIYGGANNRDLFLTDSNSLGRPVCSFNHMAIISALPVGTPTGGAGIGVYGFNQRFSMYDVMISGFYRDVDIVSAYYWSLINCHFSSPVADGIRMDNTQRTDTGDWSIMGCNFISGAFNTTLAVGLRWKGGGGVKIINCKFDAQQFTHTTQFMYLMVFNNTVASTSDIQLTNISAEDVQVTGLLDSVPAGLRVAHVLLTNVQFAGFGSTGPMIDVYNVNMFTMVAFNVREYISNPGPAIRFTNCKGVDVAHGYITGYAGNNYAATGSIIDRLDYTDGGSGDPTTPAYTSSISRGSAVLGDGTFVKDSLFAFLQLPGGNVSKGQILLPEGPLRTPHAGLIGNFGGHLWYANNGPTWLQLDQQTAGANGQMIYNSGGTLTGSNLYTVNPGSGRFQIGSATASAPIDLSIVRNVAGLTGAYIENSITSGTREFYWYQDATHFFGQGLKGSAIAGNWAGTNFPQAGTAYDYTFGSTSGSLGYLKNANPYVVQIGQTTTNIGFRADPIGFRITANSDLGTANTVSFEAPTTVKLPGILRKIFDSTLYKIPIRDVSGNIFYADLAPILAYNTASTTPTLQQVFNVGGGGKAYLSKSDTISGGTSYTFGTDSALNVQWKGQTASLRSQDGLAIVQVNNTGSIDFSGRTQSIQSVNQNASFSLVTTTNALPYYYINLTTPSANSTVTIPTQGSSNTLFHFCNTSTSGSFSWSFTGGTVTDGAGNTIVSIPNSVSFDLLQTGSTTWTIKNISNIKGWAIAGSYSSVGTATTTFTVTIGITEPITTYKVNVTPTDILGAALFYVTNKTATTFDVVYLSGLTGTVTFDWNVIP